MKPMFARHSIEVQRAPLVEDRYGNESRDWGNAESHTIEHCALHPVQGSEEIVLSGDTLVQRWRLFAPAGADVVSTDRVTHQDVRYEIDGEVQQWTSASHRANHVEAVLKRWESH